MKKIFYITTILTISLCSCSNKQSIQSNNWELKVCHRPDPSSHQENDGRRSITIPQMRLQICKDGFYDTRKNGSRPLVQQEFQYRYRGLQLRNAQSRRIACDAWNQIKDTEYTMNALSWGWWIDRIYQYNDADHVVLREATEGENRARITSSIITGLFITGDDYSDNGSEEVKNRARTTLSSDST